MKPIRFSYVIKVDIAAKNFKRAWGYMHLGKVVYVETNGDLWERVGNRLCLLGNTTMA